MGRIWSVRELISGGRSTRRKCIKNFKVLVSSTLNLCFSVNGLALCRFYEGVIESYCSRKKMHRVRKHL